MKTQIDEHSAKPTTGQAYYRGKRNKRKVTLDLIRSDIKRIREWQTEMDSLIKRCGGKPKRFIVGTLSGTVHAWNEALEFSGGLGTITILAADPEQARDFYKLWTTGRRTEWELRPTAPVQQSWWPTLLRKAVRNQSLKYLQLVQKDA